MNKFQIATLFIILFIIIAGGVIFVYQSISPNLEEMELNDPPNDVIISVGANAPKAVDITGASLEITQHQANLTIRTYAQKVSTIDKGTILWETILVIENQTDVIDTYHLKVTLNSTGISCNIRNVEETTVQNLAVDMQRNKLLIFIPLDGLPQFEQVSWSITSTYEEENSGNIVVNAFDFAPDQGMHVTATQPQTVTP
jgi:hypothetical protein